MTAHFTALPVAPSLLGESPFWHPDEAALYWCDIPGRLINRWQPGVGWASGEHQQWSFDTEPACCAPLQGGQLLVAFRDGLFRLDPASGQRERLADPPYNPRQERFNDGKCDPQGRLWVGTLSEPRTPDAALYRFGAGQLASQGGDRLFGDEVLRQYRQGVGHGSPFLLILCGGPTTGRMGPDYSKPCPLPAFPQSSAC